MRKLLQRAIAEIEKLPPEEQDEVAARILADLADEQGWTARFNATTDEEWDRMAEMVRREIASGGVMQRATNWQPSKVEYALALAAYKREQEGMKAMVQEVLGKYGKPKTTLKEFRASLDAELGDISLSRKVVRMREEGF